MVVASLDQYDRSLGSVHRLLEIGLPILLAVVGLICWVMVGRALRRIEALRREVAEVAVRPGEHRVAEPRTDDEVGRLARTLNSMLDRLEASSARERRFVADASHELRSPIANIRTAVEVALHRPEAADWPRVAGEVLDEDARMARLVEELLLLARSDEGRLAPVEHACDVLAVARNVAAAEAYATPPPVTVTGTPSPGAGAGRLRGAHRRQSGRQRPPVRPVRRGCVGPGARPARPRSRCATTGRACPRRSGAASSSDSSAWTRPATGSTVVSGSGLAIVADLCRAYGGTIEVRDGNPGAIFSVQSPGRQRCPSPSPVLARSPIPVPLETARR